MTKDRKRFFKYQTIGTQILAQNGTVREKQKQLHTYPHVLLLLLCCPVTKLCLTLCDPMDCSMPGSLSFTIFWSLLKFMSIESMLLSNHLILFHPLLFLPLIFPSIRVFSNESALLIRWPKYWSFSFSVSPSNEYSGLISFRID